MDFLWRRKAVRQAIPATSRAKSKIAGGRLRRTMDEISENVSEGTNPMPPQPAMHPSSELRKRRSSRIVQAVPLAVTGVDAIGRPFTEHTSSLIINCHGCRFQSKHYVLKNMWVRLEIPPPETGQPPRVVRGRVAWIQRPRTVRQLFQVALELETPGNVWGIAFPPEDWFAFPEAALHGAHVQQELPSEGLSVNEVEPELNAGGDVEPVASYVHDNLRAFPSPVSTTQRASMPKFASATEIRLTMSSEDVSRPHPMPAMIMASSLATA